MADDLEREVQLLARCIAESGAAERPGRVEFWLKERPDQRSNER